MTKLNIEKYEDELLAVNFDFKMVNGKITKHCDDCEKCDFKSKYSLCPDNKLTWLLSLKDYVIDDYESDRASEIMYKLVRLLQSDLKEKTKRYIADEVIYYVQTNI